MTIFIQTDATGAGAGSLDPNQAAFDLAVAANGDTGLGLAGIVGNHQQVTYARTLNGAPPLRLDALVNTNFTPDYGAGPQAVPIVILPVLANFVLNDGTSILVVAGTALPPQGSGLAGAGLNTTTDCLVIYDTTQNNGSGYCTARAGSGGTLDLQLPNPIILYHELSHAFRIVTNALLALTAGCDPSSPEENAAITDENDLRTQIANATGVAPVLRDPGIHCGIGCGGGGGGGGDGCCIIASVASRSPISAEVQALRAIRDQFLRKTDVGFAFFEKLLHDYYDFSPQVCTMMSRELQMPPLVLDGYVRPLISALRLMHANALGYLSDAQLGRMFASDHPDRAEAGRKLEVLQKARGLWEGTVPLNGGIAERLAVLLRDRAWSSDHVQWALIEPVRIYAEALSAHVSGSSPSSLGRVLRQAFTQWGPNMPIDHIWASLSARQIEAELKIAETILVRTPRTRTRFRKRLLERFGDITAIRSVLGGRGSKRGALT